MTRNFRKGKSRPNAVSIHGGGGLFMSALSRTNRSTREGKCPRAPHLQRLSIQTMNDKHQTVAFFILLSGCHRDTKDYLFQGNLIPFLNAINTINVSLIVYSWHGNYFSETDGNTRRVVVNRFQERYI